MAKKEKGIRLSKKHGVNPSVMLCFFCNEPSGVALLGHMKGDVQAPHQGVFDKEPCTKCKGYMEQGVILISVKDGEEGENPYRTGGWVVVKVDAVERMLQPEELRVQVINKRMAFVPDAAWDALGLPRGTTPAKESK